VNGCHFICSINLYLVLIHKRGGRDKCENYRETALRNAAYKILSNILLEEITVSHILEKLQETTRIDSGMEDQY
jgi:hypothetical protein